MRSRGHAAAAAPPADPCDEALAQVTAEQAALEQEQARRDEEEHDSEQLRAEPCGIDWLACTKHVLRLEVLHHRGRQRGARCDIRRLARASWLRSV